MVPCTKSRLFEAPSTFLALKMTLIVNVKSVALFRGYWYLPRYLSISLKILCRSSVVAFGCIYRVLKNTYKNKKYKNV